jgi:hypothetical protein
MIRLFGRLATGRRVGWLGVAFLVVAVLRLLFGSGWFT